MPPAAFLTVEQLVRLAGLTDRHLRRLAADGCFPKAVRGRYPLVPTIQGLLRYYREREESRLIQNSYDGVSACAAATGIPVSTLKHARRRGCPAFREGRVYLVPLLRWLFPTVVNHDQERAQHVVLQNAKLQVELRQLKHELLPVEEVTRLGVELGSAIRKVITRTHRLAPSLEDQPASVIETRLQDHEDEIVAQLQLLDDRLRDWQRGT